jgi:quercetin dioxygenase-like cupin family protein
MTVEQEQARGRRPPRERFAGTEHVYDLGRIAAQLRAEPRPAASGHRQMTIVHHGQAALVLFDFEAQGRLVDHVADGLVTIHVLAGQVQVRTSEGDHDLDAGTLLVLSPGVRHDLHASTPSQVLLTVHLEPKG